MKKYQTYTIKDFEGDAYFRRWVCHPDEGADTFWEQFQQEYPEKRFEITEARNRILSYYSVVKPEDQVGGPEWEDRVWRGILAERVRYRQKAIRKQHIYWKSAIGFLSIVALGLTLFRLGVFDRAPEADGTPQITLKLQDGTEQIIDETDTKTIITEQDGILGSQEKQVITYGNTTAIEDLVYNEITVPYSKQFELVLSDGSHIYLNSGTHLRYPVQFLPGQPRQVYLNGEAFFEVARDTSRPFTVVTNAMNTEVYGTRFNVSNYNNESNTFTVLVDGSVGTYSPEDSASPVKIVPGQRAIWENGEIKVEKVEIRKYTAWTRGQLYFVEDPVDLIFKALERHYNLTIVNTYEALNTIQLTSSFGKNVSIEEVLSVFQRMEPFSYSIEGNTVRITAPDNKQDSYQ